MSSVRSGPTSPKPRGAATWLACQIPPPKWPAPLSRRLLQSLQSCLQPDDLLHQRSLPLCGCHQCPVMRMQGLRGRPARQSHRLCLYGQVRQFMQERRQCTAMHCQCTGSYTGQQCETQSNFAYIVGGTAGEFYYINF